MFDKSHWPNAEKLAELRENGIVPDSKFGRECAVLAAVVGCLWVQVDSWDALRTGWANFWTQECCAKSDFSWIPRVALNLIAMPAGIALFVCLLLGILQTGFYLSLKPLEFRISRISPSLKRLFWSPLLILEAFAGFVLAAIAGSLALFYLSPKVWPLLSASDVLAALYQSLSPAVYSFVTIMALIAILSPLTARLIFAFRHRMSERELASQGGSQNYVEPV